MYKKRILGLAIASAITLTGCLDDDKIVDQSNAGATQGTPPGESLADTATYPVFFPASREFPLPNDLLIDSVGDGTFADLGVPNPIDFNPALYNPVLAAIGGLSGTSTSAPIDIEISRQVDPDTVDASPYLLDASGNLVIIGSAPVPNPNQNVFLIELNYASGSALQGLPIAEPPTITPANGDAYTAEVKTLDGTSYIRILPKSPLTPATRYVVAITNGVKDINGDSIIASPGVAGYATLKNENKPLANPALAPVRSLIINLWEKVTSNYFTAATNQTRNAQSLPLLSSDNIVLSYGFTTSGDEKVLNYIADPQQWFNDQIRSFIGLGAAESVVENQSDVAMLDASGNIVAGADGQVDHSDVSYTKDLATAAFPLTLSPTAQAALGSLEALFPAVGGGCTGLTPSGVNGSAYIDCLSKSLAHPASPIGALLPTPSKTAVTITSRTVVSATATLAQGHLDVPYYLAPPADIGSPAQGDNKNLGTGAPIKYLSWEANTTLATAINVLFDSIDLELPQGVTPDASGNFTVAPTSTAINYIFPFPKKQDGNLLTAADYTDATTIAATVEDVQIPFAAVYPTAFAGPMKTMMLGHGLGGSRSIALGSPGLNIVEAARGFGEDVAVVAIDQPLHGLSTLNDIDGVLEATSFERHFDYGYAGAGLPPGDLETLAGGDAGAISNLLSLNFLNTESFLTTRDNGRQNVLDLLTVRKSIEDIDIDGVGGADLDGTDVYYQGYSLGTVSAQAFVAVANDTNQTDGSSDEIETDNIQSAFFSTPGGGIARFIESSPAFAANIINGLANINITPDTASYQLFLNTIQAAADGFDGINFVGDYADQGTPVFYFTASNDQIIPVSQVPVDENDTLRPLAVPAQSALGNTVDIDSSISYLSGAEPLLTESNATAIETAGVHTVTQAAIRFKPGAGSHFGPCPATVNADPTLDGPTTFGSWSLGMLDIDAAVGGTNNDGTLQIGVPAIAVTDWIDAAPIEYFFIDPTQCAATI